MTEFERIVAAGARRAAQAETKHKKRLARLRNSTAKAARACGAADERHAWALRFRWVPVLGPARVRDAETKRSSYISTLARVRADARQVEEEGESRARAARALAESLRLTRRLSAAVSGDVGRIIDQDSRLTGEIRQRFDDFRRTIDAFRRADRKPLGKVIEISMEAAFLAEILTSLPQTILIPAQPRQAVEQRPVVTPPPPPPPPLPAPAPVQQAPLVVVPERSLAMPGPPPRPFLDGWPATMKPLSGDQDECLFLPVASTFRMFMIAKRAGARIFEFERGPDSPARPFPAAYDNTEDRYWSSLSFGFSREALKADPEKARHWEMFLPEAYRSRRPDLRFDQMPVSARYHNIHNVFTEPSWDAVKERLVTASGRRCVVCGKARGLLGDRGLYEQKRPIECHEVWAWSVADADNGIGVQSLHRIVALCSDCHAACHKERTIYRIQAMARNTVTDPSVLCNEVEEFLNVRQSEILRISDVERDRIQAKWTARRESLSGLKNWVMDLSHLARQDHLADGFLVMKSENTAKIRADQIAGIAFRDADGEMHHPRTVEDCVTSIVRRPSDPSPAALPDATRAEEAPEAAGPRM